MWYNVRENFGEINKYIVHFEFGGVYLSNQENKEEKKIAKEYTIRISSNGGQDVRNIHLPAKWVKCGIASVTAGALLLVGAFGYSTYTSYSMREETVQIERLQEVNNIQQEQLLQLSKKADELQNQLSELSQMEMELRQITGMEAGADDTPQGNGGDGTHDGQGGPVNHSVNIENISATFSDLEQRVAIRKASIQQLKEAMKEQQTFLGNNEYEEAVTMPSIWPTTGDVSSPYGLRWGGSDFHPGIDIADDAGTPIVATADGVVTDAGWNSGGYGNMVDIDHGNGYVTRYAHAQAVVVSPGQYVRRGQVIAYMGSTGYSTGPHLHYEVRINGKAVNPAAYL